MNPDIIIDNLSIRIPATANKNIDGAPESCIVTNREVDDGRSIYVVTRRAGLLTRNNTVPINGI